MTVPKRWHAFPLLPYIHAYECNKSDMEYLHSRYSTQPMTSQLAHYQLNAS